MLIFQQKNEGRVSVSKIKQMCTKTNSLNIANIYELEIEIIYIKNEMFLNWMKQMFLIV